MEVLLENVFALSTEDALVVGSEQGHVLPPKVVGARLQLAGQVHGGQVLGRVGGAGWRGAHPVARHGQPSKHRGRQFVDLRERRRGAATFVALLDRQLVLTVVGRGRVVLEAAQRVLQSVAGRVVQSGQHGGVIQTGHARIVKSRAASGHIGRLLRFLSQLQSGKN